MSNKIDINIYEPFKDEIIKMYKNQISIKEIFKKYNISQIHFYECLKLWGVDKKRERYKNQIKGDSKDNLYIGKISPELKAQRAINTQINNDKKKGIQYVKFVRTTADQYLVSNIINHSIIG